MCVIIHLPKGKTISWEQLKKCYDRNPDGYGIMAAIDGKVKVIRSIGSFEKFREDWKTIPADVERAIHFRWKTHGTIDTANCHPFPLTGSHIQDRDGYQMQPYGYPDIWLMHNGVIKTLEIDKTMSDTYHFTEFDLGPVVPTYGDAMAHPHFQKCIEDCTSGSKILLMDGTGRTLKTFPTMWTQRNGVFFSNSISLSWENNSKSKKKKGKADKLGFGENRYGSRWEGGHYGGHGGSDLYPYGRAGGYTNDELEADEEQKELSIMQAMGMSDEDLADFIQDNPWETLDFIRDLLGDVPISDRCDALADDCDNCGDQGGMPVIPGVIPMTSAPAIPAVHEIAKSMTETQRLAKAILNHRAGLPATPEVDSSLVSATASALITVPARKKYEMLKLASGPVKGSAVITPIEQKEEPEKKTA